MSTKKNLKYSAKYSAKYFYPYLFIDFLIIKLIKLCVYFFNLVITQGFTINLQIMANLNIKHRIVIFYL